MTMTMTSEVLSPRPDIESSRSIAPGVFVVDDLLPDAQRKPLLLFLRAKGWKFGKKSHAQTDIYSFWVKHFAGHRNGREEVHYACAEELRRTPVVFAFWRYLEGTVLKDQTLIRCYANGQSYGSDGTIHTDSRRPGSYTAVYYPHDEWHPNWAGETVIFNADRSDIVASIYPRPNRLLVFAGDMPHLARGVSRTCPELRITLMCKTGVPDELQ
jgi:SM-20-related protein